MKKKTKWTFMVYLAGDNNLSTAGDVDLGEMRTVGSTREVNIIVEVDNAGDLGTTRYHIKPKGKREKTEKLGETDSGSPDTLLDFIRWAGKNYPAERYALILWNHGGGWAPSEMDRIAQQVEADSYSDREAVERSASPLGRTFFRTSLEKIFSLPSPSERAICSDDGSGHSLDTIELGNVLAQAVEVLGQPLDLLGMDACLMSNLEVAYQVRPFVRYIVASEETEPNEGWPYDAVLQKLVQNPAASSQDLAAQIVDAYIKSYVDRSYAGPVTQAALDVACVDSVAGPVDELVEALLAQMPVAAQEMWTAQRKSTRFFHNTLWDMSHFCEELIQLTASEEVRRAAQAVIDSLEPGPGKFLVAQSHNGAKVECCGGVTIYLLPPLTDISRYYSDLDYAKNHRWLELLEAYHSY